MVKLLSKYRLSAAASFVLAAFLFWFACSEIGQYTIEKQHPPAQDYCQVVRVIKTEISKTAESSLSKLKADKTIRLHHIDEINLHIATLDKPYIESFYPAYRTTQIYLFDKTLLI